MDAQKRARLAVAIALVVVFAVFGSFAFSLLSVRAPHIVLPAPGTQTPTPPSGTIANTQMLEVTPETVQAVIATLNRSSSYYRQLAVQTFWEGGSGTTTVQTWTDDGYTHVRALLPTGQVRNSIQTPDGILYYWYGSGSAVLIAPTDSLSEDLAQRLPTYEDVLALDAENISDAGYVDYEGHPCVFVETLRSKQDYVERYWIGVDSGLLVAAQTLKAEQVIYSVNASSAIQTPCPPSANFRLPDGTVLHSI